MKFFIPGITGKDLAQASIFTDLERPLIVTIFYLLWKVQLSTITKDTMDAKAIQQMESQKYLSKQLATNKGCKILLSAVALSRSLGIELPTISKLSEKDIQKHLSVIHHKLVESPPPRGSKILSYNNLTPSNVETHRYGIMASISGLWQSKPVFDPKSILQGINAVLLDIESAHAITIQLFKDLEIPLNPVYESLETYTNLIIELISFEEIIFMDGIQISDKANRTPIEQKLNVTRTIPTTYDPIIIPSTETNKILIAASLQYSQLSNPSTKTKKPWDSKIPKPTPPPVTPPQKKGKPNNAQDGKRPRLT
jgi:hypothetical protein